MKGRYIDGILQDNILTRAEARAIPDPPRWNKINKDTGWPRVHVDVWQGIPTSWTTDWQKIECRLLQKKYTQPEAVARCEEIHGTTFDGVYASGRFFVFWSGERVDASQHLRAS